MRKLTAVIGACILLVGCDTAVGRTIGSEPDGGAVQSVPRDAVASVDGVSVAMADYDRWFRIIARSSSASVPVIPDPPSYRRCVAALRERAGRSPAAGQLRARCRTLATRVRRATMQLLVQAVWFEKEAEALGIEVSDAKVESVLRKTKRQFFRSERDYRRFLRSTGMTEKDVLFRLRIEELATAIARHVRRGAGRGAVRRLERFAREFQERWSQRTECRTGFAIRGLCDNAGSQ